jgi:hypothetical protein
VVNLSARYVSERLPYFSESAQGCAERRNSPARK